MTNVLQQRKTVRMLFDEAHSDSWTISRKRAEEINPHYPENSSYQIAANALAERDFVLTRNLDSLFTPELLLQTDLLALLHPTDPRWERTASQGSQKFSQEEITAIQQFVSAGGGLLVVTENEHEKYGDNLNDLLSVFGLEITNATIIDKVHCIDRNPAWILGEKVNNSFAAALGFKVEKCCFYQAGVALAKENAQVAWRSSASAHPAQAGLIAASQYGRGRVILVTDSLLFGDERILEFDHLQLWQNLCYWLAAPRFSGEQEREGLQSAIFSSPWLDLKKVINRLRQLQGKEGAVEINDHEEAGQLVNKSIELIETFKPLLSHQAEYFEKVQQDFQKWQSNQFVKPDFVAALAAFHPEKKRIDGIEHLVVFPMYTPNASMETRFEAIMMSSPWPDWLLSLEKSFYKNDKFAPGHLIDFTEGYRSECAVLFPETVSVVEKATNEFAVIFCNREAKRLQAFARRGIEVTKMDMPPELECFLGSLPLVEDTLALWDLVHDQSHSLGELPFDPFMIRQRSPYWMYALEELRVDLRSFHETIKLAQKDFPFARYVPYAILFDRIFRFPIVGNRVRNYDALGGQLFFSYLHQKNILIWADSQLTVRWDLLPEAVNALREEIITLYRNGADISKLNFWLEAHDLISRYVRPNVGSVWKKDSRAVNNETEIKKWLSLIQEDEFPLGSFHLLLQKKIMPLSY